MNDVADLVEQRQAFMPCLQIGQIGGHIRTLAGGEWQFQARLRDAASLHRHCLRC
jgi:hypothetical protein